MGVLFFSKNKLAGATKVCLSQITEPRKRMISMLFSRSSWQTLFKKLKSEELNLYIVQFPRTNRYIDLTSNRIKMKNTERNF